MSAHDEVRAERLSPEELDGRIVESPIAYLPLGTLEFHGPHLPIGLDAFTGHAVCVDAALRGGGIVLPSVYQGFGGGHGHYPWTMMMDDGAAIEAHLRATVNRLDDFGVRRAVVFSGHFAPEQLEMIDELAATWNAQSQRKISLLATAINRCPDSPLPPDHAGRFETTMLTGVAPELVHLDRLPSIEAHPADDPDGDAYGEHRHDQDHPLHGVFGPDPRLARPEDGPELPARRTLSARAHVSMCRNTSYPTAGSKQARASNMAPMATLASAFSERSPSLRTGECRCGGAK